MFPSLNQSSQYPLGGSLSGNQQQQTVSGVRIIDTASIRGTTRFNDLHDDIQAQIMNIDNVIQAQIKLKNDCDAIMPSHDVQLSNIPNDVDYCNRKLKGLEDVIETDAEFIAVLRDLIKSDAENAKLSFRAIDNLKLPPQYHNSGTWPAKSSSSNNQTQSPATGDAQDIVGFFSSTVDELSSKLEKYQKNVTEIEQHLRGVEASTAQHINALVSRRNGSSGGLNDELQELAESLQDFERSILHVAGKVGGTREGVQSLQLGGFMKSASGIGANGKRSGVY
jgi:nucleoporin p58/p45